MTLRRRKHVVAMMAPAFLIAHLLCMCPRTAVAATLGSARTQTGRAETSGAHHCCPKRDTGTPRGDHPGGCQHCGHTQMSTPDTVKLPLPSSSAIPLFLSAPAGARRFAIHPARHSTTACGTHSPPRVLASTCTLLI
jgi:hypothetical protein